MKFAVGYRPMGSPSFYERMERSSSISQSCIFRGPASRRAGPPSARWRLRGLYRSGGAGGRPAALSCVGSHARPAFNSNCMGEYAISEHLRGQVSGVIDRIEGVQRPWAS